MKLSRIMWIVFLTTFLGTSCASLHVPIREYPKEQSLTIETSIPAKVERGEVHDFVVVTNAGNNCFSAIQYFNITDKNEAVYLPQTIADENGECIWRWEVPSEAKSGIAEFRAYVEKIKKQDTQSRMFFALLIANNLVCLQNLSKKKPMQSIHRLLFWD